MVVIEQHGAELAVVVVALRLHEVWANIRKVGCVPCLRMAVRRRLGVAPMEVNYGPVLRKARDIRDSNRVRWAKQMRCRQFVQECDGDSLVLPHNKQWPGGAPSGLGGAIGPDLQKNTENKQCTQSFLGCQQLRGGDRSWMLGTAPLQEAARGAEPE